MKSVPESLEYFLKPEVLDGDNQYCCQACDKKVDAVKGLKFDRLPYLLSLQLKRFDFDYETFQRIKLNDEVPPFFFLFSFYFECGLVVVCERLRWQLVLGCQGAVEIWWLVLLQQ